MKKYILTLVCASVGLAFAQTKSPAVPVVPTAPSQAQAQSQTTDSNAVSAASNQGNAQSITFTSPPDTHASQSVAYSGSQTVRNVPSVNAPPLASSNDTCMGSVSGSLNVAGFGGSIGSTWVDENCRMLKNGRELWNMGMRGAALALLCTDRANREAMELTGFECAQTTAARRAADRSGPESRTTVYQARNEPTDPIVRRRLGLPVLP